MWDNVQFAFTPVVLPFTILLLVAVAYWIFVITGLLGMELFDIEWDVEADADAGAGGDSFAISTLKFFHVGEVPIMVIFSFFSLSMWVITYLSASYVHDSDIAPWIPILLIGPNLLLSLLITRFALLPFRSFFRSLNDVQSARTKIVGQVCLITSLEVTQKHGQAEIAQDGPSIVLNVKCKKGEQFRKGDAARIDSYCKESNTYLVVPNRTEV